MDFSSHPELGRKQDKQLTDATAPKVFAADIAATNPRVSSNRMTAYATRLQPAFRRPPDGGGADLRLVVPFSGTGSNFNSVAGRLE